MCVSTTTLVYLLYAAGDLLHFIFMIDMLDGRRRGEVCVGGGNAVFSNSACTANGLIFKAYTLQRYSDKKIQILIQRDKS